MFDSIQDPTLTVIKTGTEIFNFRNIAAVMESPNIRGKYLMITHTGAEVQISKDSYDTVMKAFNKR